MRIVLLTASAIAIGLAGTASVQAALWSPDSGISLFQPLSINTPTHQARSQILPASNKKLKIVRTASDFPVNSPVSGNVSVHSPSTDNLLATDEMAGPKSASPSRASFVPQIAQKDGEADPVLVAQVKQNTTNSAQKQIRKEPLEIGIPSSSYWGDILAHYTHAQTDGLSRFDYAALKASSENMKKLDAYISHMAKLIPSQMPRDDAMAYWANLYNALTVQVVAENFPVKSIRKIKSGYRAGPWKRNLVTVEGRKLSLDDIEHNILRPTYQTPLVHYMVNCASVGCPNLKATPWQSTTLAADQAAAARAYINSPHGVKITKGRLQVSSIYKWFKADFGNSEAGVLAHLNQYADADLRAALSGRHKIDKYAYDWDINAPK